MFFWIWKNSVSEENCDVSEEMSDEIDLLTSEISALNN